MPLLGIYCTFSIQSVVYLHVFRLLKKRRFELFFYMRILLTLLLQTVYIFNCYFSETFLELNSLTKATTSISHLWNSLNLCGESKYHNRYICHPFIHSFWMFKVIKRSIFIAFIVIQVIDDRIYFDLPSVQNVNSNNYFRCLWMSGFISLNTIYLSSVASVRSVGCFVYISVGRASFHWLSYTAYTLLHRRPPAWKRERCIILVNKIMYKCYTL